MAAYYGSGNAEALELVAQLKYHALGGFFADARNFCKRCDVIAADSRNHFLCLHAAQNGDRELGADAAHRDQPLEQFSFLRTKKTVERKCVFADVRVNVERDLAARVGKLGKRRHRDRNLVADAIDVYN